MKHFILLYTFLFISLFSFSQKIEVETGEKSMSKGQQLAFTVVIPDAKLKDVEPVWKRYVNNRGLGERIGNLATQIGNVFKSDENKTSRDKLKVEKNGDELYIRSIEEESITSHSMDVYARMTEFSGGCQLSAFFQYTDSVFINESNVDQERIQSMKSYVRDFGIVAYKSVLDDQIKEAKKEVSRQEDVLKDINSGSKKEEKAIARYETDIQECNAGIFELENDIVRLDENITAKKVAFTTLIKKTPEYEEAKKELKDLAKEKSRYFGKIKSQKSKIKAKEADIKAAKGRINQNDIRIEKQQLVISDKEKIVEEIIAKKEAVQ
jgi:outer membrane murein-binding lipoprotein Lpp